VFASNFLVTPFVAASESRPDFHPNPTEVQRVVEVPVKVLLDHENWEPMLVQRGELEFHAPSLAFQGCRIWGATAVILGDLQERLGELF